MFILPRKVINLVNSFFRSFLWIGVQETHQPGNVNWEDVRRPKKHGDLGIRNLQMLDLAVVGKIVWHLPG